MWLETSLYFLPEKRALALLPTSIVHYISTLHVVTIILICPRSNPSELFIQNRMVMGKSISATVCLLILQILQARPQYYFHDDKYYDSPVVIEIGGSAGVMNCLTDLGGKKGMGKKFIKDLNWKFSKPSFGVYVMGIYKYVIGLRLEASFGSIQSYDSILKNVAHSTRGRYERNLSFKSRIRDAQLALEFHPIFLKWYNENESPYWSVYLVAGLGFFSFSPQARMDGQWYALQPLRTEGQGFIEYPDRKPYRLRQFNIPLGMGIKYELSPSMQARIEIVHRLLFTDYLDDVSTRYIDPSLFYNYLVPRWAPIAERFFDRQGELNQGHTPKAGSQRGDPGDRDSFFSIQLKLGVSIRTIRR